MMHIARLAIVRRFSIAAVLAAGWASPVCAADGAGAAPPAKQPTVPTGTPPAMPLDAATARRGEKAAQEYLDHEEANKVPASAESVTALADAELLLLETKTFLDQGDAMKAGERYLDAGKKLLGIPVDQRTRLGERYRKASAKLTSLSTELLTQDVYNPVDETANDPSRTVGPAPATPPATKPSPAEASEH